MTELIILKSNRRLTLWSDGTVTRYNKSAAGEGVLAEVVKTQRWPNGDRLGSTDAYTLASWFKPGASFTPHKEVERRAKKQASRGEAK